MTPRRQRVQQHGSAAPQGCGNVLSRNGRVEPQVAGEELIAAVAAKGHGHMLPPAEVEAPIST